MKNKYKIFPHETLIFFGMGIILCSIIILFFEFFPAFRHFYTPTPLPPFLEEGLKFLGVFFLLRIFFFEIKSTPFLGLGFGLMEGIWHFFAYGRVAVPALWVHIILGLIMTLFFFLAQKSKNRFLKVVWYLSAFLIPVFLHYLWNFLGQ